MTRFVVAAFGRVCLGFCLLVSLTAVAQDVPAKRALKHSDYEIWNAASGFKLSPDGKTFVYTLTPPEGDAALVLKTIEGGEIRIAVAGKAAAASETPSAEAPAAGPGPAAPPAALFGGLFGAAQFSPDSKTLFAPLTPTKGDIDKAKADKKKSDEMPKTVLGVIDVASGKVTSRIGKIKGFTVVGEGTGFLIHQNESKIEAPKDEPKKDEAKKEEPKAAKDEPKAPVASRREAGSTLVVRNLKDDSETKYEDVASYLVTKDAKTLLLTIVSKTTEKSGLYAVALGSTDAPKPIKAGPGRTSSLTWDEAQSKMAFFFSEVAAVEPKAEPKIEGKFPGKGPAPIPAGPSAKVKVLLWDRAANEPAKELLASVPAGTPDGFMIVDRGGLSFSADGKKLTLAVGPIPPEPKVEPKTEPKAEPGAETLPQPRPAAGATPQPRTPGGRFGPRPGATGVAATSPDPEKVDLDLWHWKDELIQPMQKLRGAAERVKTYRAVYFFDTKTFRQTSTEDQDVPTPNYGDWTRASSDKPYRGMQWLSPLPRDYAFVNIRTGETKPWLTANVGIVGEPIGDYAIHFDGKDWKSTNVLTGKTINLTAKLGFAFQNEEFDIPTQTPPYGLRGTTVDRKYAVIADRHDLWKIAIDGSTATNITQIGRATKTNFSLVLLGDDDSTQKLDFTKPYLLRAEHDKTGDTGFYRLVPGQKPKLLVMAGKRFGPPTKAKSSDAIVLTTSTFYDYPDYFATDLEFKELRKITDLQPQKRDFNWGKAELVGYKSTDGIPLQGMLIKPENFDSTKQYPMIVYIYERLTNGLHTFRAPSAGTSINPTYYASNGYLVFMPDICYTTGSPGQSAIKCVLPAIQAVVDQGCVNEAAIGIQGHSWGGYQIAYMITQTNRFKAANAGAPVSDMVSAYGGIRWGTGLPRQFQYEQTQSRIGATLWQAPMKYIENSPIFMADRVKTPLMMLHNDQDDAVPWYQGIEYYLALRRLGKEVYLFNYNGEFHGLRKKSTQRDYTVRMQQFFDHHLKGAPMPDWMAKGVPFSERDSEKEANKKLFAPVKPAGK